MTAQKPNSLYLACLNIYRFFRSLYDKKIEENFNTLLDRAYQQNFILNFDFKNLSEKQKKSFTFLAPQLLQRDSFKFLPNLLGVENIVFSSKKHPINACLLWGTRPNFNAYQILKYCLKHKRPLLVCEDGFLRSKDIAAHGSPGLSCLTDRFGIYYDAHQSGDIAQLLNRQDWSLTDEQLTLSQQAIQHILRHSVSKYNIAPPSNVDLGDPEKTKILVIDQRKGDQSIAAAGASAKDFNRMLEDAIAENPNADIFVKTHPDANSGIFWGYYSHLSSKKLPENVHLITQNINPISLLSKIDKIYVVCSQMGFEGLLCGAEVYCYGAPFYSGWGITTDRGFKAQRLRTRTLEEIFYAAYINFALYCDNNGQRCNIFKTIEEIAP